MSQVRYIRQKDQYSCGPIAIMNILKWSGVEFSYREAIKFFQKICNCRASHGGTTHSSFDWALRRVGEHLEGGLHIRRVYRPALWQIEEHLKAGGVIALNYHWRKDTAGKKVKKVKKVKKGDLEGRHFILLVGVSEEGQSFLTVNEYHFGPALVPVSRKFVRQDLLRFQRTDSHGKAWFVSLKD